MLTRLDDILFPNRVEVYDFHEINKFFYPIFKCGSTSMDAIAQDKNFKKIINEQIRKLSVVDVFIRNPKERYISGVQTYLYNNTHLNVDTVKHYLKQGIILDRHFAHQYQWIINLARYLDTDAKIYFHNINMMNQYCQNINIVKDKNTDIDLLDVVNSPGLATAFTIDQIILDELTGQSWTVKEMFNHLNERCPTEYSTLIGKAYHVLPKI